MGKAIGILLAGGIGSRFQGSLPKQYCLINGHEMIWYSIQAFKNAKNIDDFVVVLNSEEYHSGKIRDTYNVTTVLGGESRNHSIRNALEYIKENYPDCEKVIENNAACPLTTSEVIDKYCELLSENDFVQTSFKITDALGSYKDRTVDREDFFLVQSPVGYNFKLLYDNFNPDHPNIHPPAQLPADAKGYNYFDYGVNFKVTYPEDISIVEAIMNRKNSK